MFGDKFKRKYALSDKGVHNTKMSQRSLREDLSRTHGCISG